ncbi:tRNA (adenosine(37)-N6)-dimethylallyltransferase MiaA, partial [[Clostridium] scindens]
MSIGTAKITEEEMQRVPHYLVDYCSFTEEYNVKIFQEKAREYIAEITKHGHLPIICGGTGLYIKSCLYDYQFVDQPQDTEFMNFLAERSTDEIWGMLSVIDPKACENLHPHNRQRIVR